jgi:hypothetical protein
MVYLLLLAVGALYAAFVLIAARFCGFNDSNGQAFIQTSRAGFSRIPTVSQRSARPLGNPRQRSCDSTLRNPA